MKTIFYLAMTAEEMTINPTPSEKTAYLACHFSPYGPGLTDIPSNISEDTMLILTDRIPFRRHNTELIAQQLASLPCRSLLLDFQHMHNDTAAKLISSISSSFERSIGVSERYAGGADCAVFVETGSADCDPLENVKKWNGREIWLDISPGTAQINVNKDGSFRESAAVPAKAEVTHRNDALYCHYAYNLTENSAVFTLWRNPEDAADILRAGKDLGVTRGIGLYQEWKSFL